MLSGFFGDGIADVTGVIGRNGSGKSNAIEILCKLLKESKTAISSDFLIVEKTDNDYTCHFSFGQRSAPNVPSGLLARRYSGEFEDLKVVFFSNVYDGRKNNFGSEISDISLSAQQILRFPGERSSEFLKQYRLVQSQIFEKINIDLPAMIRLRNRLWQYMENARLDRDSLEVIRFLKRMMRSRIKELAPHKKLLPLLRLGIFLDIYASVPAAEIQSIGGRSLAMHVLDHLHHAKEISLTTDEITRSLLETLERLLPIEYNDPNGPPSPKRTRLSPRRRGYNFHRLLSFARELDNLLDNMSYDYVVEGARTRETEYFTFDYSSPIFKRFAVEFIESLDSSPYFDMDWIGLSSGHKAYLNLFSSLYEELKRTRHRNIFLCIDEGDLYLHPKWQVEFLSRLISTLPYMCSGSVQLVLTSHSPFLVSDLPNQSLIILDRQRLSTETDGTNLEVRTFGGNLYDLYSSPFFLEEKRMSDFAFSRIKDWVIEVENSMDSVSRKKINQFVDLIGDEVIRFRLKKALKND